MCKDFFEVKQYLFKKINTKFFRNILTLFFGSVGSQILSMLFIPILTRMYDVENFGSRAVMIFMASLLGIIATGCYEQAILLPEKDSFSVAVLAGGLSLIVSVLTGLILFILPQNWLQALILMM